MPIADASSMLATIMSLNVRSSCPVCMSIEKDINLARVVSLTWKVAIMLVIASIGLLAVSVKAPCAALMYVLLVFVPNPSVSFSTLMSAGCNWVVITREASSVVSTVPPTRVLEKMGVDESFWRVRAVKFTLLVETGSLKVKMSWSELRSSW